MKEMRTFLVIWVGQVVSLLGSGMSGFALGIWILQQTGSATRFGLVLLCSVLPGILVSPFAGVVVDRMDRRRIMIFSDAAAAVGTAVVVVLMYRGGLEAWHVYLATAASAVYGAFQRPAYSASVTVLVPKEQYGRASGMMQAGQALSQIFAPLAAGGLVFAVGVPGVLLIDLATFLVGVATLLAVRIPSVRPEDGSDARGLPLWRDTRDGWAFIQRRPGLLGLLVVFAVLNLSLASFQAALGPMVLGFASAAALGAVMTSAGVGMLAGSVAMGAWGGPRLRIHGIVGAGLVFAAALAAMGLRPSLPLVTVCVVATGFAFPILAGCSQAIWQVKTDPAIQGRVFSLRSAISNSTVPVAYLACGLLIDRLVAPLLARGGAAAHLLGVLVGDGPGRGAAVLMVASGGVAAVAILGAALLPRIRRVEHELPDMVKPTPAAPEPVEVGLALEVATA
ncbi:MAG: MFS transporter [Gemmatimonadetes bacterium]|nr:MFS transporter [Gemmatimonadota bacterium]